MAIKIFQIRHHFDCPSVIPIPDPDQFASEVLDNLENLSPMAEIPEFQLADPSVVNRGFFKLSNRVLVFSKDTYSHDMGAALDYCGNVHKTKIVDTGEDLFFLNITARYNCIDIKNTMFYSTGRAGELGVDHGLGIKSFAFHPKLIGDSSIFRISHSRGSVFTVHDEDGNKEDFYSCYQNSEAYGLKFDLVWESE